MLAASSTLTACGGPDGGIDLQAMVVSGIIGGQTDTDDPSVVALVAQSNDAFAYCTAEVIAPTVVLTAAHCVLPIGAGTRWGVVTEPSISAATTALAVREVYSDPLFNEARVNDGHDIGVAILDRPLDLTPLPFNRKAMAQAMVGAPVRLVGYGVASGTNGTGGKIKRQVTTRLNQLTNTLLDIGAAGQQGCNGDSGGPAFMTVDGVETIVGLTSYGVDGCASGGFYTRVDAYTAFIDAHLPAMPDPTQAHEDPEDTDPAPAIPPARDDGMRPPSMPRPSGQQAAGGGLSDGGVNGGCTCLAEPRRPAASALVALALIGLARVPKRRRRVR